MSDDDGAGSGDRDFKLTATLQAGVTYILVFTTYSEGATTPYTLRASGPDDVYFNPIYTGM
jgi:hypothetical protein